MRLTGHDGGMQRLTGWKAALAYGLLALLTAGFWYGVVWLVSQLF